MERLEEELTCAICCDIFSDPRVLPCSHTFCLRCVQGLLPSPPELPAGLSCPSCRARLVLPAAGPEALPINFALKAVIEKCRQEERAGQQQQQQQEEGTCRAHPQQPLNIYCLQDRRLVCGQCITVGKHRGHAIDDLRSAYRRAREASGQLLEQLTDPARSKLLPCSEGLQQHKARCQSALRSDREAALRYFKELGDALEQKKAALLRALDELESCISEKYDPLIEEVENLKLEENELKELYSALQKEESPLLFLEKLQGLQLRLQALRQKQLPEPGAVEIAPSMEEVLQELSRTEIGQLHKLHAPKLQLAPKSSAEQTAASALWAALTEPGVLLLILSSVVLLWHKEISSGAIPAPLSHLWRFLLRIYQDCCTSLQDKVRELCFSSALPLELCRKILPDYFG